MDKTIKEIREDLRQYNLKINADFKTSITSDDLSPLIFIIETVIDIIEVTRGGHKAKKYPESYKPKGKGE